MLRAALCTGLLLAACHRESDPPPVHPQAGELPPLPPSSGTPIGYLVDSATQLKLSDDQIVKLKQIDQSLAVRNEEIDTQLRVLEKPSEDSPPAKGAGRNAPAAKGKTGDDATKLQSARKANDTEALKKAFGLLDPDQQIAARKLLEDRGIAAPGSEVKPPARDPEDGVPLEPRPPGAR